jgi:poly(A) polymerase
VTTPIARTPLHLRDAPWLSSPAARRVLELLNGDGEEARVIGGAVRNALIGIAAGDLDVATTAEPDEVMRRAARAGIRAVPTGVAHGTVTLLVDGQPFEVTTLREDVETDGRHARVVFGRDWARDAARRDFTMNALSVSIDGVVHDYCGGVADLAARRVRFIGEAARRIAEDYLRILRFFRIHAIYGEGECDAEGFSACIERRAGLLMLSAERVRAETFKLVVAPRAGEVLTEMNDAGLLQMILAGVAYLPSFDAMVRLEQASGEGPDALRRLAALAAWLPEDAGRLSQRLRLSNAEASRLESMADGWWRLGAMDEPTAKRLLYRLGPDRYADRAMLAMARAGETTDALQALASLPSRWTAPLFPLKAADFIARGLTPGPRLGAALKAAEDRWIETGFPESQGALEALVTAAMQENKRAE